MAVKVRRLTEADVPAIEKIERQITKSTRTSSLGRNVMIHHPDLVNLYGCLAHHEPGFPHALGEALLAHFKGKGVVLVRTLVEWHAGDMIAYLKGLGFDRSDMIPLERRL